jgi:LysR family transcriptional regulator for bpeEF and oprC
VLDGLVYGELSWSIYTLQRRHVPMKIRELSDFLYRLLSTHPDLRQQ